MTTSKIQMDQIRSTSATVTSENIRAGSQKKSSLSQASGLHGASPDATCSCPSGDGSLRHPCPAHPAPVEQAGGDERDLQGAQGERDGWGPFPIVQVPWNVFDRAVMWVEDRRRYGDDGTIVDDWKALKTIQCAALAQPSPKCATCNDQGHVCLDWEAGAWEECPDCAQAEAERPEVVGVRYEDGTILSAEDCGTALEVCAKVQTPLMTVAQHERIAASRWERAMDLMGDHVARISDKLTAERDAALARVEQQERTIAGMNEAHAKLAGLYEAAQAQHSVPERLELTDDLKNILGRPNFTCTHLAQALRQIGFVIDRKAEAEQAACLHWMLNHYLANGANWKVHAEAELKAAAPGKEVGHE
ncbi:MULTISPECIES: hypothetical protein [unclassified Pseudomonas]|uniref:hypothetical protein n=1 Tax=unclassified Pseudomonas TaxID=196821 RepID=UPI0021588EDC|nr:MULTISPECIES: hypothetical protein [unclassified Pseudomonas]